LVLMRGIIFGLNHALFTSALGVGLGYARYAQSRLTRRLAPLVGLLAAILLHMTHNFFVSLPDPELFIVSLGADWFGVVVWLTLMLVATQQEKRWIAAELREEVMDGLLPPEQALAAASYRARLRDRLDVLQEHGFGHAHRLSMLHNAAAELAIKKRQLRLHGDEGGNGVEVVRLRAQIAGLLAEELKG
ncbi:MAG: PrsW family intramembrane metalloprotease, partial [Chloroflexota bacterium]|nr:PrsW family intramembrane metalloprotease [Chloroflexota bacterium]